MAKQRVDALLVEQGLADSREQAKRLILAGAVLCGTERVNKASQKYESDAPLNVKDRPKFVGRGGFKIEGALEHFGIDVTGLVGIDVGASTGGFTDCLLQRGAAKVHAIDVGTNQLVYKLRTDPRVISREQFNARDLSPEITGELVDIAVMDLSFISLTKVLPALDTVLKPGALIIPLIKPQFELSREEVGRGGIVKEPELHQKAVKKIKDFATEALNWDWQGIIESPIKGTDGNTEFLAKLNK